MPDALDLSSDGAWIAKGNTTVDVCRVGGEWTRVSSDGTAPKWLVPGVSLVYTRHSSDGPFVRADLTAEGGKATELHPRGFNGFCASGERWAGYRSDGGAPYIVWWDNARTENASSPAISASGVKAWLQHNTGDLYVAGQRIDGPNCRAPRFTGEWLAWEKGGQVYARRPGGSITPALNVELNEGTAIILLAPDGEVWLLTNGQRRTLLRPLGAYLGYELARAGDQYNPAGAFVGPGRALVIWSPNAGGVESRPIDTTTPRVDLRPPAGPVEDTSGDPFDILPYMLPAVGRRQRTGSHDMCWFIDEQQRRWWEIKFSNEDSHEGYAWDAEFVRLYEDRSQSEVGAEPPLDYAFTDDRWCRRVTRVGEVLEHPSNTLIRFDPRTNRVVSADSFPYRTTVLKRYAAIDCGGQVGIAQAVLLEYWPLYPSGRPETNLYAMGWGRVEWSLYQAA